MQDWSLVLAVIIYGLTPPFKNLKKSLKKFKRDFEKWDLCEKKFHWTIFQIKFEYPSKICNNAIYAFKPVSFAFAFYGHTKKSSGSAFVPVWKWLSSAAQSSSCSKPFIAVLCSLLKTITVVFICGFVFKCS